MASPRQTPVPTEPEQNGIAIRAFRDKEGATVDDVASFAGITAPHYRNIENEHRNANPRHLALIARRLNVPTAALLRTRPAGAELVAAS